MEFGKKELQRERERVATGARFVSLEYWLSVLFRKTIMSSFL